MNKKLQILGFAGSLRAASYNRALLRIAASVMPDNVDFKIFDLKPIPLYDGDVEDVGFPESVQEFRSEIAKADALLIATPEYNHSFSGVLKNAIDWASRPPDGPLPQKPVALFGAAAGMFGSATAQQHLRHVLGRLDMYVLNNPTLFVPAAYNAFDSEGNFKDDAMRQRVQNLIAALIDWTNLLKPRS